MKKVFISTIALTLSVSNPGLAQTTGDPAATISTTETDDDDKDYGRIGPAGSCRSVWSEEKKRPS